MREQILEIAQTQLKSGGYPELSFSVIAKKLGTTRANLHYHFQSKEKLAIEVITNSIAQQQADLLKLGARYQGKFSKLITALEDWVWDHYEGHGAIGVCPCEQVIRQSGAPESLTLLAKKHFDVMNSALYEHVVASQKSGDLTSNVHASQIATEANCLIHGLGQLIFVADEKKIHALKGMTKKWISNYKNK